MYIVRKDEVSLMWSNEMKWTEEDYGVVDIAEMAKEIWLNQ